MILLTEKVLRKNEFNSDEKLILAFIDSSTEGLEGAYESDDEIASMLYLDNQNVSKIITKLLKKQVILDVNQQKRELVLSDLYFLGRDYRSEKIELFKKHSSKRANR
jgi:uncharacterized protein YlbG (UPF0298 family)